MDETIRSVRGCHGVVSLLALVGQRLLSGSVTFPGPFSLHEAAATPPCLELDPTT